MPVAGFQMATFPKCGGGQSAINRCLNYRREKKKEMWSNIIDCTWSLLSDYPGRQRDEGQCTTRRKVVLEMSHYSIQEVEQRAGTHGYRATGPILPDGLRVRGEAARGGSSGGTGGGSWIC